MSGGSYNYLCYESFPEIMERTEDMETIAYRLIKLGAKDIAEDIRDLINYCKDAKQTIMDACERLHEVFRAVEWFDSGDIGEDDMQKEIKRYRNGKRNVEENNK